MEMFKWVGRKKREEAWMKEPRRVPDYAKDLPATDVGRWVVSREFVNDEDKNLRVYLAAWQANPARNEWEVMEVTTDLKTGRFDTSPVAYQVEDPMKVVQAFRDFETKYKANAAYIPNDQERPTYRSFANKHGIHFDDDGRIFRVEKETPLAIGTFMNRDSLDKLFHGPEAKAAPLDSWAGLYEGLINKYSPDWTVTEETFGVLPAQDAEGSKTSVAGRQPDAEEWTAPAPPPAPEPEPLSAAEANESLNGLKAAFRKAAEADTGPAQPLFERLRDQFARALDETTRNSGKPSAQVFAEMGPLINKIFQSTMGDIMVEAMKDDRAMDTFKALVSDVTEETRTLKNSVPRRLLKDLPDAEKNGVKPYTPPPAAPTLESTPSTPAAPALEGNTDAKPEAAAPDTAAQASPEASAPKTTEAAAPVVAAPAAPAAVEPEEPPTALGMTFEELRAEKTFAGFQQMQKLTVTRQATPADLAGDPAYAEYADVTQRMIAQLKTLPQILKDAEATPSQRSAAATFQYAVQGTFRDGLQDLAQHEAAATALVGLLRAGNELFSEQFRPGKKSTAEGLQMVSRIGDVCVQLAVQHLGVDPEEAKKISSIITKGKDPYGPELPLEKLFAQFPPPAPVRNVPRAPEQSANTPRKVRGYHGSY